MFRFIDSGWSGLRLAHKGAVIAALAMSFLMVGAVAIAQLQTGVERAQREVSHLEHLHAETQRSLNAALDSLSAARGYILTGEASFRHSYSNSEATFRRSIDALAAQDPSSRERLREVSELVERIEAIRARQFEAVATGRFDPDNDEGAASVRDASAAFDRLTARLSAFIQAYDRAVSRRREDLDRANRIWKGMFWVNGIFGILVASTTAFFFSTFIGRRLRAVEAKARQLERGMPLRVQLRGNDEICRLDRALHRAAELIAEREAFVRTAQSRLAGIIEGTRDQVAAIDLDFRFMFFNKAFQKEFQRLYGRRIEVGESLKSALAAVPGALAREVGRWERALGGEEYAIEEQIEHRGSRPRFLEVRFSLVRDGAGNCVGAAQFVTDITERKASDEHLRETIHELAEEKVRAERATQAKSEFLARMSHEIRSPLTAIIGMADLLWGTALNSEQTEYVRIARRSGESLLSLIDDILDLSRVEAGHMRLSSVDFDLEDALERAMEVMAQRARQKGLELAWRIAPDTPCALMGDPDRLEQILMNLAANAIKFTDSGGISLNVEPDGESGEPGRLRFCVGDTGIGIAPEKQEMIFDIFTQADSSIARNYGGTGLGLAIAKHLVGLMQGRIWVDSALGQGSRFHFTALFGLQPRAQSFARPQWEGVGEQRALIVDDNATSRLRMRDLLAGQLAAVGEADTGQSALEELERARERGTPYSVVLVDSQLPDMAGLTVAGEVRRLQADAVVIVLLAIDGQVAATVRQNPNVSGSLLKPVSRAALFDGIRAAVSGRAPEPVQPLTRVRPSPRRGRRARILLAEDNEDIVVLMRAYLKSTPHEVILAGNGQVAFELFQSGDFDLVLMDMQMPVMDGYAATRAIRDWESRQGRHRTPILALTAYALKEEVHKSQEAGCDAHLSKPIHQGTLLRALREHLERPPRPPAVQVTPPPAIADLVPRYLENRRREIGLLNAALESGDFAQIRQLAHGMKGSGAGYGFPELTALGRRLEAAAIRGEESQVQEALRALATYLERVEIVFT
jgi:two-component system sensor histidine kinase/response regulator